MAPPNDVDPLYNLTAEEKRLWSDWKYTFEVYSKMQSELNEIRWKFDLMDECGEVDYDPDFDPEAAERKAGYLSDDLELDGELCRTYIGVAVSAGHKGLQDIIAKNYTPCLT